MLCSLFATRIKIPYGGNAHMKTLQNKQNIQSFFKKHNHSVIIFGDYQYILDFMDYGISKYKDRIGFATAPYKLSSSYYCTTQPCFQAFHGETPLKIKNPPPVVGEFALYLARILQFDYTLFHCVEEVRRLFFDRSPSFVAVDYEERPPESPEGVHANLIPSHLLREFGLEIPKGLYVYNPTDKQLLPMTKPYEEMIVPKLIDPIPEQISSKPYLIAFNVNENGETADSEGNDAYYTLSNLYSKYNKSANFAFLNGQYSHFYEVNSRLNPAKKPYFVIFNSTNITRNRWLILDHNLTDVDYYDAFVERIISGKEPFTLISKPIEEQNTTFKEIVANNFKELVLDNPNDTYVAVTAPWCGHCSAFKPILANMSDYVVGKPINIYWFDGTANDFGKIPDIDGYPTFFAWPAGKKNEKPVKFDGDRDFNGVLQFLNTTGAYKFPPPVNTTDAKDPAAENKEL